MGMVGGGRTFIGAVHRMAANLDGKIELVAGAFSSSPEKSKLSGEDFFLDQRVMTPIKKWQKKRCQGGQSRLRLNRCSKPPSF